MSDDLVKKAQILEKDPVYVASELSKIIKIMLSRMSPNAQTKSFINVKNKLKKFNIIEISGKKNPGGAAIGVSLGLVKNVLNGKDPYFINVVLQELLKRL
jgi:hypothetical protein